MRRHRRNSIILPEVANPADLKQVTLTDWSEEEIRDLMRKAEQTLKDRKFAAATSLKVGTLPGISPEFAQTIRNFASRLSIRPLPLAEKICALRAVPEDYWLDSRDGHRSRLLKVIKKESNSARCDLLIGDGRLLHHEGKPNGIWEDVAEGEYILLGRQADSDESRRFKIYHQPFLDAWTALPLKPSRLIMRCILTTAAARDMPSEALVTYLTQVARRQLTGRVRDHEASERWIHGRDQDPTIGDLLRPVLARIAEGAAPESFTLTAGSYRPECPKWAENIVTAINRWLTTQNLIEPDLLTDPIFDVTLNEIWTWNTRQNQLANYRAGHLRNITAAAFGFTRITFDTDDFGPESGGTGWAKVLNAKLPETSRYDTGFTTSQILKKNPSVLISDTFKVYINGTYRCIVDMKSNNLPAADNIVRRMWTLATTARNQISTLAGDRQTLEALFADCKDTRLWDSALLEMAPTPDQLAHALDNGGGDDDENDGPVRQNKRVGFEEEDHPMR